MRAIDEIKEDMKQASNELRQWESEFSHAQKMVSVVSSELLELKFESERALYLKGEGL